MPKKDKKPENPSENKARDKALELAINAVKKKFGNESILSIKKENVGRSEIISSGCVAIDKASGVGGYPVGRIIEIFGPESGGKTTIALHAASVVTQLGEKVLWIDAEHSWVDAGHIVNGDYASKIGVDLEHVIPVQKEYGEENLEILDSMIRSGAIRLAVVDSLASLVPMAEIEGSMSDQQMGLQARMISKALRKITAAVNSTGTILIFVNQTRMNIGGYGNPETTPGGKSLRFYATMRMSVRRVAAIKEGEDIVGNKTKIKFEKNKIARPFTHAECDLIFGQGINNIATVLDWGVDRNIIEKSGAWYSYSGERIGQGRTNAIEFLKDRPELYEQIKGAVLNE